MKLGLLADIHEEVEKLCQAVGALQGAGAEQLIVLGDVFENGRRIDETVAFLREATTAGVWGNHDSGFCPTPSSAALRKFAQPVHDYFATLQPRLVIAGCHFTHVLPFCDPCDLLQLWYVDGVPRTAEQRTRCFAAGPESVFFVGHFHRWGVWTPDERLEWDGASPLRLDAAQRYLVACNAVSEGFCVLFDTDSRELLPFSAGSQ
jgi:hypothetical protein